MPILKKINFLIGPIEKFLQKRVTIPSFSKF